MTWSIVARDRRTGSFGAAVATRFVAAAGLCLNVAPGIGALCTQALINPTYGPRGLQLLGDGRSAGDTIADLLAADAGRDHRQVHAVDAAGDTGASTGSACHDWAGHLAGNGVSVAGNLLAGPAVVQATLDRYLADAALPFADRLLSALQAGQDAGGDQRGQQSAGILIHGTEQYPDLSLRVDEHPTPLAELRRIYGLWLVDFAAARTYMATRDDPAGVYDESVIDAERRRRIADPRARTFPS